MDTTKSNLIKAEQIAIDLYRSVEDKGLISAGKDEKTLNEEIYALAKELFGIEKHWHKRIVRSGENTLHPYKENPPNRILTSDDILFFDFGPIIENWEADLGRTYVIGNDTDKIKIKNDIEQAWAEVRDYFHTQTNLKANDLYDYACKKAEEFGWEFGGEIAGHLIGEFPHSNIEPETYKSYVRKENDIDMFAPYPNGQKKHWILEMHFVDREKKIGAFYEQLLT